MILVKNVEIEHVHKDYCINNNGFNQYTPPMDDPCPPVDYKEEIITGRTFINAENKKVVIGWTKEVEEVLGLPFTVFVYQRKMIHDLGEQKEHFESLYRFADQECVDLQKKIENAGFWKPLNTYLQVDYD